MRKVGVAVARIARIGGAVAIVIGGAGAARVTSDPPGVPLPPALRQAAIATRTDRHGSIAGARIDGTDVWVVYIRTAAGCGSGGCVPQLWRRAGRRYVRYGILQVARLPIVVLPGTAGGMPLVGVTVFDKAGGRDAVQPLAFDGRNYAPPADALLLAANAGRPLLTASMLRGY